MTTQTQAAPEKAARNQRNSCSQRERPPPSWVWLHSVDRDEAVEELKRETGISGARTALWLHLEPNSKLRVLPASTPGSSLIKPLQKDSLLRLFHKTNKCQDVSESEYRRHTVGLGLSNLLDRSHWCDWMKILLTGWKLTRRPAANGQWNKTHSRAVQQSCSVAHKSPFKRHMGTLTHSCSACDKQVNHSGTRV